MSLLKIEELINKLIQKLDGLVCNENLEVIAAKIIKEVLDEIGEISKQPLETEKSETEKSEPKNEKRSFQKYSFPNFNVGNPSLGSSKSPNALTWPFGSTSND
uniref:Virion-associated protein n=1 Tax=Dahlia mosaic virus TaxID=213888 RepID=F2X5R7_DMV|nr:DNA binding protein [Dahlia mosaic virus]